MLTKLSPALVALSLLVASIPAQTVAMSVSALTPLVVTGSLGGQTTQASMPAGPLAADGSVTTSPGLGSQVGISWYNNGDPKRVDLLNNVYSNLGGPAFSGHSGPHEFLIDISASSPAAAVLKITRSSTLTPGASWPTVQMDIGNDGSIEFPNVQDSTVPLPNLGSQPTVLRVILDSQLTSNGTSSTWLELEVLPDNNMLVTQTAIGCGPPSYVLDVGPTFVGTGVGFVVAPTSDFMILVLGLGQQPTLLPSTTVIPCLLVPSPDALFAVPPGIWLGTSLPVPAAMRPIAIHAQAVGVSATGLLTTNGFTVSAF